MASTPTYRSVASASSSGSNTLTINKPADTADADIMLAFVAGFDSDGTPTLSAPAGWTQIATRTNTGILKRYSCWWKRASGEGASYDFTKNGTASNAFMSGFIASASGCAAGGDPVNVYSNEVYIVNDTTIRAAGVTTTLDDCLLVFLGSQGATVRCSFSTLTERLDTTPSNESLYCATGLQASAGASGDKDGTLASSSTQKHAFLVALSPDQNPAEPVISAPTAGTGRAPGYVFTLTATGTDPEGSDVYYRWKYDAGAGDQAIGDSDPVASGQPESTTWDTDGLDLGTYTLKCWTLDALDQISATYDSVEVELLDVLIVAPKHESSHITGEVDLTAKGYLGAAGSLYLQWEIDTNTPPDDESEDYDLITSALVAQDAEVTVVGNVSHLGTWYVRARTVDEEENPSAWTAIRTIYVLEMLRLDAGSRVEQSILPVANKVYVRVEKTAVLETATNTTTSPTYAESPRETLILIPDGDSTAAAAVAAAQLALRKDERVTLSGLRVRLEDGMKLERGQRVGVRIDRLGISTTLPIRELVFDVAGDVCEISLGDFWEPRTDEDALVALAQKLQQLEKEAAA